MKYDRNFIYDLENKKIQVVTGNKKYEGKVKNIFRNLVNDEIHFLIDKKTIIFGEPMKIGKINNNDYVFIYEGEEDSNSDEVFFENLSDYNEKGYGVDKLLSEMDSFKDTYIFLHILN